MATPTQREHSQRSEQLGDSLRNFLIAVNTGGIGAILLTASNLAGEGFPLSWTLGPSVLFVVGLLSTGWSIYAAQHRAGKRNAAPDDAPPQFPWWKQSRTWNLAALACFAVGALWAVCELSRLTVE